MLAFAGFCAAVAQQPADSAKIYFRINHRQYDPSLRDNAAVMKRFVNTVRHADSTDNVHQLIIRSYASPDGLNAANDRLTANRCAEVSKYIIGATGVNPSLISSVPGGIAWDELRALVAATPQVPARDRVLDVLDNTPLWIYDNNGRIVDGRKKQLMDIAGGTSYRWMFDNLFPQLRNAVAVSLYLKSDVLAAKQAAADAAQAASDAARAAAVAAQAAADAARAAAEAANGTADAVSAAREAADRAARAADDSRTAANRATAAADEANTAALAAARADDVKGAQAHADQAIAARAAAEAAQAAAQASCSAAEAARAAADAIAAQAARSAADDLNGSNDLDDTQAPAPEPLHRFALKTNMLYYAALMPNIELQWRVNDLWSLSLEANVAWWKKAAEHRYYQLAMISPEVRRWINPRGPWHGMYAGAFAGFGWYDLENRKTGYKGEGALAGLSFGYMWPVGRNLSLEAGIGVGYMYTRYKEYIPYDGHYLYQRTSSLNYFGPLKLKFAIAWRFNDINKKKGAIAL